MSVQDSRRGAPATRQGLAANTPKRSTYDRPAIDMSSTPGSSNHVETADGAPAFSSPSTHAARQQISSISVVVPLHNEAENIEPLWHELHEVLESNGYDYEVIFVDDGSRDQTLERLRGLCQHDPRVTIIELRRNFGQTAAMAAGFDHARGDVVIPMDGDMQNDPHDIPALLTKCEEPPGYDVVSGWRKNRHDTYVTRKLPSRLANGLIGWITKVKLHDYGCTLKAYRRDVLNDVHLYSEMHRFLPALAAWEGARVTEIPVNHRPRTRGQTKYGLKRTFAVVFDLLMVKFQGGYMTKPLYWFGKMSLWFMGIAVAILLVAIGQRFGYFGQDNLHLNRNVLVLLSSMLAIVSAQFVVLGVLAELMSRIYHESQDRPTYRIRRIDRGQGDGR